MLELNLNGKIALVTGGSDGLGRAAYITGAAINLDAGMGAAV